MNLKPILQIQGDKLDAYKKVRGVKAAKKNMLEAMKKDVEGRFSDYVTKGQLKLHVAYTTDEETARQWKEEDVYKRQIRSRWRSSLIFSISEKVKRYISS